MLKLTSYFFLYTSTTCLVFHSSFLLSLLPLVTIGSCVSLNAIFLLITFCLAVWTDFQVLCCLINKNSLHQTCLQLPIVPLNLRIIFVQVFLRLRLLKILSRKSPHIKPRHLQKHVSKNIFEISIFTKKSVAIHLGIINLRPSGSHNVAKSLLGLKISSKGSW